MTLPRNPTIWSIGHSRHELSDFINLLKQNAIDVVVDVRTSPFSKMTPQFNKANLEQSLKADGIQYLHLGESLGGRPTDDSMYDDDGHVFYNLMAETQSFNQGLDRLITGSKSYRVAVMCSEGSPEKCHRTLLIGRVLQGRGFEIINILPSGDVQVQLDLNSPLPQQSIFGEEEVPSWRSAVSVRQESQPEISSEY